MGAARLRISQRKSMDCHVCSDGGTDEERTEYPIEAAELHGKVCKHGNRKLVEELYLFLTWSKLLSEDYTSSVRNIKSCANIINERVEEKCLSSQLVLAKISITTSHKLAEIHTFFLWNTKDLIIKQLALVRDEAVVLRPLYKKLL